MRFNIFRNPLFLFLSDSYADNGQVAVGRVAGSHTRIDTYRSRKRWYKKIPDFSGLCLIPAKRYYVLPRSFQNLYPLAYAFKNETGISTFCYPGALC